MEIVEKILAEIKRYGDPAEILTATSSKQIRGISGTCWYRPSSTLYRISQ